MARTKSTGPLTGANLETTFLWTRNFGGMREFYHETLGLPIAYENAHFADFRAGSCSIALHAEREPHGRGDNWHMEFLVEDIRAVARELANRGVTVSAIRKEPFGQIATFHDPEGNEIGLEEPPKRRR